MLDIPQVANGGTRTHTQAAHLSPSSGYVPEGGRGMPRRLGTAKRLKWAGALLPDLRKWAANSD